MDPLSITASIITIVQLTGSVIGYLNGVRKAPKECQQVRVELANLYSLIIRLECHLAQADVAAPEYSSLRALAVPKGPFEQYYDALKLLESKTKCGVVWKFSKSEVTSILERLEHLKSLVGVALELDHFKLSRTIRTGLDAVHEDTQAIKSDQSNQEHRRILKWLSPIDFLSQQHDLIKERKNDTGKWFLESLTFKDWLQGSSTTLFCPGMPGAGKTTMAAIAIDHLHRAAPDDQTGIAYVYCNYKSQHTALDLLAALLRQLLRSQPAIVNTVCHLYETHSQRNTRPSLNEILDALHATCLKYSTVYIVVDALDECPNETRCQLLDKLRGLQHKGIVRIMATSRFQMEIEQEFKSATRLEVRADQEDVRRYVAGELPRLPKVIQNDHSLGISIQNKIAEAVEGMFLLARLHVDSLLDKRTKNKVLSTLANLKGGSKALDNAYRGVIERINGQLEEDLRLAKRVLSWMTYAKERLTIDELCHALAIEPGMKKLDEGDIPDIGDVVSVCAGLVVVDEESRIVRLVHYTTEEYFERICVVWNPTAQQEIALTCLAYLSLDTFRSGYCDDGVNFDKKVKNHVFMGYVAKHWSKHIRPVQEIEAVFEAALSFFRDDALLMIEREIFYEYGELYYTYSRYCTSGLHLSAKYGLHHFSQMLLDLDDFSDSLNWHDEFGHTPFTLAILERHDSIVKLFLDRKEIEAKSKGYGQTPSIQTKCCRPKSIHNALLRQNEIGWHADWCEMQMTSLSYAARNGDEIGWHADCCDCEMLSYAVRKGDENSWHADCCEMQKTPLSYAARKGDEWVVKRLLDIKDVNADSRDIGGRTPLSYAAAGGYISIVGLFLDRKDINADSRDNGGYTPLLYAAEQGHESIVQLFLTRNDVNVNSNDGVDWTPLCAAVAKGHESIVKLFLTRNGINVNPKESISGRTPLGWAVDKGHESIVQLFLMRNDVDADSRDNQGRTPLSCAAAYGYESIVQLFLMRNEVDVNSKDNDGCTPLLRAAANGNESTVKLLLTRNDVDVNMEDDRDRTPLWYAASRGVESIAKLLLEREDIMADSRDKYGRTPLSIAAERALWRLPLGVDEIPGGQESVARVLLERDDVEANSMDGCGWTPLYYAIEGGREAMVKLLLECDDVKANSLDIYGRTPLSLAKDRGLKFIVKLLEQRLSMEAGDC